jgi:hypothetical protein
MARLWDEYAVTWICAPFGEQPTAGYEETFISALSEARLKANNLIKAYRAHAPVSLPAGSAVLYAFVGSSAS